MFASKMYFQFFKDMSGGDDSDASVVPVGNSTDNANVSYSLAIFFMFNNQKS